MANDEDSEIGYGKPPKSSQFNKGQSGNPKGRPKGSQNLAALFENTIRQKVTITENGRTRVVSKARAIFLQMINLAAKGDMKASHEIRYWSQRFDELPKVAPTNSGWHESDEAVVEGMMKRMEEAESSQSKRVAPVQVASKNEGEA